MPLYEMRTPLYEINIDIELQVRHVRFTILTVQRYGKKKPPTTKKVLVVGGLKN